MGDVERLLRRTRERKAAGLIPDYGGGAKPRIPLGTPQKRG